jgi:hypothetical protein
MVNASMTSRDNEILTQFPSPPGSVLKALELLQVLRRGDADEMAECGDLSNLPRPWDPSTCSRELRAAVWSWCDKVAAWINHEYAWRPTQMIPLCWPHHAHIARELPVLAFQRWTAQESTGYEATDDWHRYALPMFLERMQSRLGESACRTGKHVDWPAEGRVAAYNAAEAVADRQSVIHRDGHRVVTDLHANRRA